MTTSQDTPQGVLHGLTVVDFSANAAGPVCGMLLADFGAKVIKVEPPSGDATRQWGVNRFGSKKQLTGTFLAMNRNKLGVVLDMKTDEGRQRAGALIREADVVLHSFLPRVARSLSVDYESVRKVNPRAIHCTISGFGSTGPLAERPAFDMLLQAFAGHMSITGEPDRPSVRIGPSSIDLVTGAHAAFGILVALRHRDAAGEGQAIEVSLFDSAVHMVGNHIADYTGSGRLPPKFGSHFPNMAPYGIFRARDREFCLLVSSDDMFQRLCAEVGRPELAADPRFQRNGDRLRHQAALHEVLEPIFKARDAAEWVAIALKLSIPVTLVHDLAEVVGHEQTAARELLHDTGIHGVKIPAVPLRLSRTPGTLRRNAPELGEHNDEL